MSLLKCISRYISLSIDGKFFGSQSLRSAVEGIRHEGFDVSKLTEILNRDDSYFRKLPFTDVQKILHDFKRLSKSDGFQKSLKDRISYLILKYVEENASKNLTLKECFGLFEAQCKTYSDKHTTLLSSHIFSIIKERLSDDTSAGESLEVAIKILLNLQHRNILYPELLDFVSRHVSRLNNDLLVDFASISHRNGLRAKHHLDIAYKESLSRIHEFEFSQLMKLLRCFSYFSYEYKDMFMSSKTKIRDGFRELSQDNMIMILNVCKTLHKDHEFVDLRDALLVYILNDIDFYSLKFLVNCLPQLTRGRKTFVGGRFISRILENVKEIQREFSSCSVSQLSEIMSCIDFWRIRMSHLTYILENLANRIKEVAFSRNLGLWADIYNTIYNTGWFNIEFMKASIDNIILEPQILHRVSTHQVVRALQTFYKLRYFHKESYVAMLRLIDADFDSLKPKPNAISEAILAAADANIEIESLYKKSFEYLSDCLEGMDLCNVEDPVETMKKNNFWGRNVITSAWSFAVMGFHRSQKFMSFLKIIALSKVAQLDHQTSVVLMALELAEATLIENNGVEFCEEILKIYGDKMRLMESKNPAISTEEFGIDDSMRDHFDGRMNFTQCQDAHFHRGRMRATKHISDILKHFGRRDVLMRVSPHYNSPYLIDICFGEESKKGIVLFSGRELLRNHLDGKWSIIDTGSTKMKRHILKNTGWKVFEINCGDWSQLQTSNSRRQYIRDALEYLEVSH